MSAKDRLRPNSVLFWLTGLIAVGIIFIGIRFVFDPLRAALDFGVPAYGSPTLAYFWTKGSRDIVAGLLLASLLWLGVGRAGTATFSICCRADTDRGFPECVYQHPFSGFRSNDDPWRHSCLYDRPGIVHTARGGKDARIDELLRID